MNPMSAAYPHLAAAWQSWQEGSIRNLESWLPQSFLRLVQLFLEKLLGLARQESQTAALVEEMRLLQQQLKQKEELLHILEAEYVLAQQKSKAFQIAIHEIKTPLTSIVGFAELLLQQKASFQPEQVEMLQRLHQNSKKQWELINTMLVRVNDTDLPVHWQTIDLPGMLDELIANLQVLAKRKGLILQLLFEKNVPQHWRTDPLKFNSILTNLLGNAIKYTDVGGVTLEVGCSDKRTLCLTVEDSGRGIEPAEQQKIFQFFQRGSNTEGQVGAGIGLALSQELAGLLGGKITVYSAGAGQGSRFQLFLPLHPKKTAANPALSLKGSA